METLFAVDWARLFVPSHGVVEIAIRGSLIYLFLFVVLRLFLKRTTGALGTADLLVIIVIADAAANAMGASYESVTEGMVLVLTVIFWNYALDWLAHRFPAFERLISPEPVVLVDQGRFNRRAMRREKVTEQELLSQLRQHGVADPAEVERAVMEGDGRLSVIKRGDDDGGRPPEDDRQRML